MRLFAIILLIVTLTNCKTQNKDKAKEDAYNVSHGVTFEKIDSTLQKQIRFVHFDYSTGVIFPAQYGKRKFSKNIWWAKRTFFTPDTSLIESIDAEIVNQYCKATIRFNDTTWIRTIESRKENNDLENMKIAEKQMQESQKQFQERCPKWQQDLKYFDKQYIGFINEVGEKLIYIQLLDFRQDPYKLRTAFGISWIDGWHGWFETNTRRIHYHIDKKLLTINEDL